MSLTPTLLTPGDVMAKMAREHVRAVNSHDEVSIGDHLYNFCITSLAMCDHLLEHLGKIEFNERQEETKRWAFPKELKVAHDIGNSSKHCVLRDRRTKKPRKPSAQDIAMAQSQREIVSLNPDGSTNHTWIASVQLSIVTDDVEYDLWEFMSTVREFWEALLLAESIPFEKLPHREHLPFTT